MKNIPFLFLCVTLIYSEQIIKCFQAPGGSNGYYAYGLTFDGEYLWVGDDLDGLIFKVDTSDGSVVDTLFMFFDSNHGLAWDGEALWVAGDGFDTDYIWRLSPLTGGILDSILVSGFAPEEYIGGLTWDGNHLWVSIYYPNIQPNLYKVDVSTGVAIDTIPSPGLQPQGLAWDGENLWNVMDDNDGDPENVYKLDPVLGTQLLSFPVPTTRPRGLAWDGQYIWLVAKGPSGYTGYIYKIDPYGPGTPEISLSDTLHDFGQVIVGSQESWNLYIYNTGGIDLTVDSVIHSNPDFTFSDSFPINISPNLNHTLPIIFSPSSYGQTSDVLYFYSNDPLHPVVNLHLSGFGLMEEPDIYLPEGSHNYGNIRQGAEKRWWLRIENHGSGILTIDSIINSNPDFYITGANFPLQISGSSFTEIALWFSPSVQGSVYDTFYIYSNDPDEPILPIPVEGNGTEPIVPEGEIIWSYNAMGSFWRHIRSIKSIPDVTGDGIDDVVAVSENDTLYLFNGNGSGIGDPLWTFAQDPCYIERGLVIVPDLNGDGYYDIVLATIWGTRAVFAVSGLTGEVIWVYDTHEYGGGGWVYEVAPFVDLNDDGIIDILASTGDDGSGTGPRRAYCLSGADGEKLWEYFAGNAVFGIRAIGDVNGDGIPEVGIGTGDGTPSSYWLKLLDGSTGLPIWQLNLSSTVWTVVPIGDINGNGKPDLAAGLMNGNIIAYEGENGSVIWTRSVGGFVVELNISPDINQNGFVELLPAGAAINSFYLIDTENGDFLWVQPSPDQVFSLSCIGDVNGDSFPDVAGGTGYNSNYVYILDGVTGDVLWERVFSSPVECVSSIKSIDWNGVPDVLVGTREGLVAVLSGGTGTDISESPGNVSQLINLRSYPIPSKGHITLEFNIPVKSHVSLSIYDVTGRRVKTLVEENLLPGLYRVKWKGIDERGFNLPSGVYFIHLMVNDKKIVGKSLLIK
jgi:outer membrane protein assembly factor BamB